MPVDVRFGRGNTQIDYEAQGLVFDIDRFAVHDGPGIRMAVFLKGCPLNCPWCHSPESQSGKPEVAYFHEKCLACLTCLRVCPKESVSFDEDSGRIRIDRERCDDCGVCVEECYPDALRVLGRWVTVQELLQIGLRDKVFYDCSGGGITLTGGEITLQAEFAAHLLRASRKHGLHAAIETSGFSPWEKLELVTRPADLILYDLKVMDPKVHREHIGVDNALILENLRNIRKSFPEKDIQIRVPCIPGISDTEENLQQTAHFARRLGIHRLALLPYNESASAKYRWLGKGYPLLRLHRQSADRMENLKALALSLGLDAEITG